MARKTPKQHADDAAQALVDLNMFHVVIAIMEGSFVSTKASADARAIIANCRNAADKCLRRHDAAMAHLPSQADGVKGTT